MTEKPETIFGRSKGITFIVITSIKLRVQLFVAKEESFPVAWQYIDVIRRAHVTLNVWQENRNVKSNLTKGKAAMGYRETEARQCAEVGRQLFY